jgi:hypothetical protein
MRLMGPASFKIVGLYAGGQAQQENGIVNDSITRHASLNKEKAAMKAAFFLNNSISGVDQPGTERRTSWAYRCSRHHQQSSRCCSSR